MLNFIRLTHAVNQSPIDVDISKVVAVYTMAMQVPTTVLLFNAGAMLPVKESREEVMMQMQQQQTKGEKTNG
jgi:heme/copper-type cytochrome/quinol oxidase subunit 1